MEIAFSRRQAITTKYFGPTNIKGSRIIATSQAGRVIMDCDMTMSIDDNHAAAAHKLCAKYGWTWDMVGAWNNNGGYTFVMKDF